jgi:uncharacterized protein (DUF885 family)
MQRLIACLTIALLALTAACRRGVHEKAAAANGDSAFEAIADRLIADTLKRNPSTATVLGVHDYDNALEDVSRAAVDAEVAALKGFRAELSAIDPATLSPAHQLDLAQAISGIDSQMLERQIVRGWTKNPDLYSTAVTQTAFVMINRNFAAPDVRLRALIQRERLMPGNLAEARKNIDNPPSIYTDIAIEQLDGDIGFFKSSVPAAFAAVTDRALLDRFTQANQNVITALTEYKTWLQTDVKPRSKGSYALGGEALAAKFRVNEMVTVGLPRLQAIAEADLARNDAAFQRVAAQIAPGQPARQALTQVSLEHPPADKLLAVTQGQLDALRQFIADHHLLTIPTAPPAHVVETPPFMRAMTTASMDTPGPFETKATEAYYRVTLPDPAWKPAQVESYLRAWYLPEIVNVSVHEVYPGHYTQFLYGPSFPSKIRKVFGASTNIEGWAHYCEQMMLDEGLANGDPKYRLAQLQDALLRDVRFIVGIQLHTGKITVDQAEKMFEEKGYQQPEVALAEAKRGTSDPTYGYYTLGKLMILKLRDDYRTKQGAKFSLQEFHDRFLQLGPLPLPLVRKALLGETGEILPGS